MELAKQFTFFHSSDTGVERTLYRACIDGVVCSLLWMNRDGAIKKSDYTAAQAKKFVEDGIWIIQEVVTPAVGMVDGDLISTDTFEVIAEPQQTAVSAVALSDLREFTKETGYTVEVDEDFYTVRLGNPRNYGSIIETYSVDSPEKLVQVMGAIRVLTSVTQQ